MEQYKKARSILGLVGITIFPGFFIYFQNAGEASFRDIWGVTTLMIGGALATFGTVYVISRNWIKSALIVDIGMMLFLNFSILEQIVIKLFPKVYYWHLILIIVFIWILAGIFIIAYFPESIVMTSSDMILLVTSILVLINGIFAIPQIVRKVTYSNISKTDQNISPAVSSSSAVHENFYLFIFDEYGGPENLTRYCNFDNSDFYQQLIDMKFNVSSTSHNEAYETVTVVPNLLNLGYVNKRTGPSDIAIKRSKLKNPRLYQILKSHNYILNILDSNGFLDLADSTYCYVPENINPEETVAYFILKNTAVYPFYKDSGSKDLEEMHKMFEYGRKSSTFETKNLFTIAYFSNPHLPWFVDEKGHLISELDRFNSWDSNVYLGQLKYLNSCLYPMLYEIIQNDPESVIMIVSDHGFRQPVNAPELFSTTIEDESPYLTNILNAVYYKGETFDIEGKTGINTLIQILNSLLDMEMEEVSISSYAEG